MSQVMANEDTLKGMYISFNVGEEVYGIEIRYVIEIIGMQNITSVPEMPPHVKGIINLRGAILPIIDMRIKFNLPEKEYDDRTCIIIIQHESVEIGLIVDAVEEVRNIEDSMIADPPHSNSGMRNHYINGFARIRNKDAAEEYDTEKKSKQAEDVILLIECSRLFESNELIEMEGLAEMP